MCNVNELYKKKKNSADKRGIDFLFTLEEYKAFYNLRNTERCFYTYVAFEYIINNKVPCKNYPTAERIDESKPYSKENCVWVTNLANKQKARFIESQESTKGQSPMVIKNLNKIKKVLSNVSCLETKMKPYREAYINMTCNEEHPQEQKLIVSPDVSLAKSYSALGELVGAVSNFELSFVQYKAKMKKVKCGLTGIKFTPEEEKSFFWIDKTKSFDNTHTIVTTKKVADALDTFMATSQLSLTELKKLCKVIVNK